MKKPIYYTLDAFLSKKAHSISLPSDIAQRATQRVLAIPAMRHFTQNPSPDFSLDRLSQDIASAIDSELKGSNY